MPGGQRSKYYKQSCRPQHFGTNFVSRLPRCEAQTSHQAWLARNPFANNVTQIGQSVLRRNFGLGEAQVYRGTGVSRRVQRTTWERSLKTWELQIPCFEEFFWGGNTLGLVPGSLPHTLGYACTFYAPTSPPPKIQSVRGRNRTARCPAKILP